MGSQTETSNPARVVLGLGGNLGDPQWAMSGALRRLASTTPILAVSGLYLTAPVGPLQPDFLNAAALLGWTRPLLSLLDRLQDLETEFGRERNERWGARTLDLDILWADGAQWHDSRLQVPHPRLAERAFALAPLLEVAPAACDSSGTPYASLFSRLDRAGIRRIAEPGWQDAL